MNFGDLRSLLHQPTSMETWWRICEFFALLEHESDFEQALDYALPILDRSWDSHTRVVPPHWRPAFTDASGRTTRAPSQAPTGLRVIPVEQASALFTSVTCSDFKYQGFHLAKFLHHNKFPSLRHLTIEGAPRETEASFFPRIIEHIGSFSKLESLHLAGFFSGIRSQKYRRSRLMELFGHLSERNIRLRVLDLSLDELDEDTVLAVLEEKSLHALEHLALARNNLSPEDRLANALDALPLAKSLETLDLSHNKSLPSFADAIHERGALPSLTQVWLTCPELEPMRPPLFSEKEQRGMALTILDTTLADRERYTRMDTRTSREGAASSQNSQESPRTVILDSSLVRLGRSASSCDVTLRQNGVSRIHATLTRHGDSSFIRDCDSTNGVQNSSGENLPSGFVKLDPYDTVHIRDFQLQVRPHHASTITEEH